MRKSRRRRKKKRRWETEEDIHSKRLKIYINVLLLAKVIIINFPLSLKGFRNTFQRVITQGQRVKTWNKEPTNFPKCSTTLPAGWRLDKVRRHYKWTCKVCQRPHKYCCKTIQSATTFSCLELTCQILQSRKMFNETQNVKVATTSLIAQRLYKGCKEYSKGG